MDSFFLLAYTLDVRLDLNLHTWDELLEAVDACVLAERHLERGEVARRLRTRHLRQSPVIGGGVALMNVEIRHLRHSRLLYLRTRTPLTLGPQEEVADIFVQLAAYPVSLRDRSLLDYLRNELPQRAFLQELRACTSSATVQAMIERRLAPLGSGWLEPH
uniref:PTS sugar transporter subunit IIA n=1 Tax=Hylemonella sp. TaxID=2066020 RepID=UPI002624FEE6|nr:PTS sugar transporter subunit IIA [Hylemonella sp.]